MLISTFPYFQTEISKRLSALINQLVPFLSQEHQQQVLTAVERAKQITMSELNAVIGVSICIFIVAEYQSSFYFHLQQQRDLPRILQQMHAQQLPGGALPPTLPMSMPHPGLAGGPSQLAALTNSSNGPTPGSQQQLAMLTKQELMLHSRPEDVKGPLGSNDDSRHVSRTQLSLL